MRIGLVADTHIPRDAKSLPPHVKVALDGVDLILHAGDIYLSTVLDELETIAPVLAARGNGDRDLSDPRVKDYLVLDLAGFKVGLTHTFYRETPLTPLGKVMEQEFGTPVDVIVFGDTHVVVLERCQDVLVVNPGSPTLPNGRFELGTVGLLEIVGGSVSARIVQLSEFRLTFQRESVYCRGYGA